IGGEEAADIRPGGIAHIRGDQAVGDGEAATHATYNRRIWVGDAVVGDCAVDHGSAAQHATRIVTRDSSRAVARDGGVQQGEGGASGVNTTRRGNTCGRVSRNGGTDDGEVESCGVNATAERRCAVS
ncbi:MAG: hypothetical protein ACK55I_36000, partial [bacterium]